MQASEVPQHLHRLSTGLQHMSVMPQRLEIEEASSAKV
jgi:hypothetical protein